MGDRSADLKAFLAARDFLLSHREDYETAYRDFRWPDLSLFNWAVDYFDTYALENSARTALWIVEEAEVRLSTHSLRYSRRSNQVGNFLRRHGVGRGDRVIVMLPNDVCYLGGDACGSKNRCRHHPSSYSSHDGRSA